MKTKSSSKTAPGKPMSTGAASRIQSASAQKNGGVVAKKTFSARAQRAASVNEGQSK